MTTRPLHNSSERSRQPSKDHGFLKRRRRAALWTLGSLAGLLALGWLGLQVKPAPFPAISGTSAALQTIPLPSGLPAPVERFYRLTYGDHIPVITSAVITGRIIQPRSRRTVIRRCARADDSFIRMALPSRLATTVAARIPYANAAPFYALWADAPFAVRNLVPRELA